MKYTYVSTQIYESTPKLSQLQKDPKKCQKKKKEIRNLSVNSNWDLVPINMPKLRSQSLVPSQIIQISYTSSTNSNSMMLRRNYFIFYLWSERESQTDIINRSNWYHSRLFWLPLIKYYYIWQKLHKRMSYDVFLKLNNESFQ